MIQIDEPIFQLGGSHHQLDDTLLKFNSSPLKIGRAPKGKDRLPTIFFQG